MSESVPSVPQGMVIGTPVSLQSSVSILEMPFPSTRTFHWVPKNTRAPGVNLTGAPEDVDLIITQEVLLATSRHVSQTLDHELGGFLLGNRYRCPTGRMYVLIDQFVEGEETESDQVSLHFTHESWRRLEDQLTTTYLGKVLVGWYHSHPRMNVFLSRDDESIHERRFGEPWKSALVLEPKKHFGGFFCWRGGRLNTQAPVDFYEMLRDDTRRTVVAWENYTGVDPIKNVTPPLAETNTKSVQPADFRAGSSPIPLRRRPWAIPALASVTFLLIALTAWKLTRPPAADPGSGPGSVNQGGAVSASPAASATAAGEAAQGEQAAEASATGQTRESAGKSGGGGHGKASGAATAPPDNPHKPATTPAKGRKREPNANQTSGGRRRIPGKRNPVVPPTIVGPTGNG